MREHWYLICTYIFSIQTKLWVHILILETLYMYVYLFCPMIRIVYYICPHMYMYIYIIYTYLHVLWAWCDKVALARFEYCHMWYMF